MKLATLKSNSKRDGELIVVSRDLKRFATATAVALTLQKALENWDHCAPLLQKISDDLNGNGKSGIPFDTKRAHSPLPRSYQWIDGSAFLHHVKLVRKARNAEMPEDFYKVPLMYQGGSDDFLTPHEDIPQRDFAHGTDFEAEVAVILNDTPMGVTPEEALQHIKLVMLVNDVTLRNLIPAELAMGFGFLTSKPASSFSPCAVTLDELGTDWKEGRVHLPLSVEYNQKFFGKANAREMHFHFGQIISHIAKTRNLKAGTIIGSGTVSNEDPSVGSSCLVEKRTIEQINTGKAETPYMSVGDEIKIEMIDSQGQNIFGTIQQKVAKA